MEDPVFEKIFTTAKYRSNPLDPWHPGGLLMKSTTFFSAATYNCSTARFSAAKPARRMKPATALQVLRKFTGQSYLLVTVGSQEVGGNFADARTIYDRIPA